MSFLFILIQPHANPAGSVVLSEQLRDLPEVIHLIHVRAEIQLQLSILPGSLVSPQRQLREKKKKKKTGYRLEFPSSLSLGLTILLNLLTELREAF